MLVPSMFVEMNCSKQPRQQQIHPYLTTCESIPATTGAVRGYLIRHGVSEASDPLRWFLSPSRSVITDGKTIRYCISLVSEYDLGRAFVPKVIAFASLPVYEWVCSLKWMTADLLGYMWIRLDVKNDTPLREKSFDTAESINRAGSRIRRYLVSRGVLEADDSETVFRVQFSFHDCSSYWVGTHNAYGIYMLTGMGEETLVAYVSSERIDWLL